MPLLSTCRAQTSTEPAWLEQEQPAAGDPAVRLHILQAKTASQLRLLRVLTGRWHSAYVPAVLNGDAQPAVSAEQPLHQWLDHELQTHRDLSCLLKHGSESQLEAAEHGFNAQVCSPACCSVTVCPQSLLFHHALPFQALHICSSAPQSVKEHCKPNSSSPAG